MPPRFIYFDLGNVLVHFDHQLAARQMAEVAGIPAEKVFQVVFESDLEQRYETGQLDDQGFYDAFCQATGTRPDFDRLRFAGSDIFRENHTLIPLVAQLDAAGYRLGILSNTSPAHWDFCNSHRFGIVSLAFDVAALSYEIGACKPDPKIYAAAAKLAGVPPQDIFFVDDIPKHVAGARQAGWDAVQYTTPQALLVDLLERGVKFNY